jgi:hypothetical protein
MSNVKVRLSTKDIDVIQALASCAGNERMTLEQVRSFDNVSGDVATRLAGLEGRGLVNTVLLPSRVLDTQGLFSYALTHAGWRALSEL